MKNLLEEKIHLINQPFYSKGVDKFTAQIDSNRSTEVDQLISSNWLKYPDWLRSKDPKASPYIPIDKAKLPAKGSKVLALICDKVKDKTALFGFRLTNYRVVEGTYYGMKGRYE